MFKKRPKRILLSVLFSLIIFVFSVFNHISVFRSINSLDLHIKTIFAEPNCESPSPGDIDFCLRRIEEEINALSPANETNKKELSNLKSQITSLTKKISAVSALLDQNKKDITAREEDLACSLSRV